MEFILHIPDEVILDLSNGAEKPLARRVLELLAVDGYKKQQLTSYQVKVMLGFEDRFEVNALLKQYGIADDYSSEELASDVAALSALLQKHSGK